ncbi:hypothetical protein [Inquilinus sp.]|uniref:hypothetical protein n=1 Tax=Inquilinus sp. TaxID=1932117 RepID=UPI0031DCFA21
MRLGIVAGVVLLGMLAGCAPKPLPPDPTAEDLLAHGAKPIPRMELLERLSDKTVYGTFSVDTNTDKAGDAWTEYFAPDGQLWYRDRRTTFRGRWYLPDGKDELCLSFREGEERCAKLYELGGTLQFISAAQGPYQGRAVSYADKTVDGDAEGFVPKKPEPHKRRQKK